MFKNLFKPKPVDLIAPMSGKLIPLDQVNDPVFAEKAMGDGFAIKLEGDTVVSPVDGEIVAVFPTMHAIGIKSVDRNEFLVHIGLDTVNHKGQGFESNVAVGDTVKKGDLLVKIDRAYFNEHNVDLTSPVIVTNLNGRKVRLLKENEVVTQGDAGILAIVV